MMCTCAYAERLVWAPVATDSCSNYFLVMSTLPGVPMYNYNIASMLLDLTDR